MFALFNLIHDGKKLRLAVSVIRLALSVERKEIPLADGLAQVAALVEEFLGLDAPAAPVAVDAAA